ncbi:putative myosin heavy chain MYA2-related [Trypanosoma rangeli]|uniref:Putative myosin heavy chain MYA2-related n=1 Tax=Trypanosoma rangeli TaxID=5698 RepID=A0A3R7M3W5_TRYRA|nr:putative myosin heavy chain MYA2-related [Trypanosoma rangeli]RNE98956.1 putative myosin heavy chain MYA2-related [Trypanosoma rangeli]|eukprot:RNE98956.1 putative myosin heavy chain MYA2-related [Trypanosoma rangeli]
MCRRLALLLTSAYRAYMRRSAALREAKARWRKEQHVLLCQRTAALYEECREEKRQLYREALQSEQTMHLELRKQFELCKAHEAQLVFECQKLFDVVLLARRAMLQEATVHLEKLKRMLRQEGVLFFTILQEDMGDVEFGQRCRIRSMESWERNRLWQAFRLRHVMQQLVVLEVEAMALHRYIAAMESIQRNELKARRTLEQRNRSYWNSFRRQFREVEASVVQMSWSLEERERARGKQVMLLQELQGRLQAVNMSPMFFSTMTHDAGSLPQHHPRTPSRSATQCVTTAHFLPLLRDSYSQAAMPFPASPQSGSVATSQSLQFSAEGPHHSVQAPSHGPSLAIYDSPSPVSAVSFYGKFRGIDACEEGGTSSPAWNRTVHRSMSWFAAAAAHVSPRCQYSPRRSTPLAPCDFFSDATPEKGHLSAARASSYGPTQEVMPSRPRYKRSRRWA